MSKIDPIPRSKYELVERLNFWFCRDPRPAFPLVHIGGQDGGNYMDRDFLISHDWVRINLPNELGNLIEIDRKLNGEIENNQVRINSAVDVITTDADGNRARFVADADGNRARAAADAARVNQHDSQLSS